jgi:type IV pilus assembly protein PilY1
MLNLNSQKNEAGLIECAQQCLMANKRRLPNVACVYTKRGAYRWRILTGIFTGLTLTATCALAASTDIADLPMSVKSIVPPNIMMMLDDSGSMNNIVPDTPYDPAAASISAPYVCPPGNRLSGGSALPSDTNAAWPDPPTDYLLQNSNGTLKVVDSNTTYTFGTTGSAKCFNPDQVYSARLNTLGESCGSGCTEAPTYYARGVYRGHYLNWYFSNTGGAWTSGLSKKPGTKSRMEIAKEASKGAIDLLTGVRLGLSTYNGSNGGSLLVQIGDIATNKTTVQTNIDGLSAGGSTPLAETLSDIGRYFATGYTGNLTLHQGQANQATASVASVFNNHEFLNSTGSSTLAAPIQKSCQKSFAMLMTDGRPDSDRYISSSLADYDGDCTGTNASNCSGGYDMKNGQTYEGSGSDYLDDVAQALYEMDLRPNLADPTGKAKTLANNNINNVSTYVIGFADPFVVNDPLVKATAEQGGRRFLRA